MERISLISNFLLISHSFICGYNLLHLSSFNSMTTNCTKNLKLFSPKTVKKCKENMQKKKNGTVRDTMNSKSNLIIVE